MAEGDTIHRAAGRLRPALVGAKLVRFEAPRLVGVKPWLGTQIDEVEAQGKHLMIHFAGGLSLRTHLRMNGSWHVYRTGEKWRKPAYLARVVVGADSGWEAVCFSAPVVETFQRERTPRVLTRLGPDLCLPESRADGVLDGIVDRVRTHPEPGLELADALLDQQIAAGIGNIFKSEACWAVGLDPFTPIGELPPETIRRVWDTAAAQLQANLGPERRKTHPSGFAVYGRQGRTCYTCGTPIRMRRHGRHQRSTYWCPRCQLRPG